jgi:outer membrane protein assembly factor BamB
VRFVAPLLVLGLSLNCSTKKGGADAGADASAGRGGSAGGRTDAGAGGANAAGGRTDAGAGGGAGASNSVSVLMHHNDLARDGLYVDSAFTQARAAGLKVDASFAGATVTGNVYAQPLYLAGRGNIPDEIIVATESNLVYAFAAATGAQLWRRSVGAAVTAGLPCGSIATSGNSLGITGTPVIDPETRTIYLDAMTADSTVTAKHFVHALNADTGAEQTGWPAVGVDVNESASYAGTQFNSLVQNQRAALTLVGGRVFVPYGGHVGDCAGFHGWVVGIDAVPASGAAFTPTLSVWATRAIGGGVWGASGIASDGTSLFFATGNSKYSDVAGRSSSGDDGGAWGDSEALFKFPISLNEPAQTATADYWVPDNWVVLDDADQDLGGTAPMLVTVPGGTPSSLVVALGKNGYIYLLDATNLGGLDGTLRSVAFKAVIQGSIINAAAAYTTATGTYVVFRNETSGANGPVSEPMGCPAGESGGLSAIKISGSPTPTPVVAWCAGPVLLGSPAVSVTDSVGSNPIVWVVGSDNELYGFDGDSGASVFSGQATALSAVQAIQTPIVANGRIFVASNSQVYAFKP